MRKRDHFANRLTNIKENHKFQKNGKEGHRVEDAALGLRHIVSDIKENHDLKYAFVWHAVTGYWGGVRPGVTEMEHYDSEMAYPVSSPGVQNNEDCECLNSLAKNGLGLVNPENNELHSYLSSASIDGVKVDVQIILETLGAGHGGRVKHARKYHQALEASIARNFRNNDFWPRDAASLTILIASVAYNTVFLSKFMQPDWDMFHSLHPMAEYHGAARAVGGCAIYVSLLKIWNLNDFTGVMGVFNCQGAGWCKIGKTNLIHDEQPGTISGYVRAKDVDYLPRVSTDQWTGDTIVYSHLGGAIKELRYDQAEGTATADVKVHGCGLFGAYSSARPKRIQVDSEEVQFGYNEESGLVTLDLRVPEAELYLWNVTIEL
ncbi:hypothetical protein Q3G72_009819 [Acer saccharum]|nr:hypothetical protein Q3G72_009819 [Acer saccharum]